MRIQPSTEELARGRRERVRVCAVVLAALVAAVSLPAGDADAKPKRLAGGLMSVGNTGIWPDIVDVRVTYLRWDDLQPGPRRFRLASIDGVVARAREAGDTLRLRIFAGRAAPGWVKRRYGTVRVYDPIDRITATVPRWWAPGYMDAYRRLQSRLAARFDDDPTVRAVTISGAMTIHAEPFIRGIASPLTRRNLLRAGYTPAKDRRAIIASLRAHLPWRRTRQILNLNPWQFVRRDGTFGAKTAFTNHAMDRFRAMFGRRAILQNNSVRSSFLVDGMPTQYASMYRHMRQLGGPISFQTARTIRVGDLALVLEWCLAQGAYGVEVQRGAVDQITEQEAQGYDLGLESNT